MPLQSGTVGNADIVFDDMCMQVMKFFEKGLFTCSLNFAVSVSPLHNNACRS